MKPFLLPANMQSMVRMVAARPSMVGINARGRMFVMSRVSFWVYIYVYYVEERQFAAYNKQ
jgi:hypothetical protein